MNKSVFLAYLKALFVSLLLFVGLSLYLFFRRGYFDLYIANKAFAGIAFVLLCFVLLLGPLCRLYQRFDHFLPLRKELGLTAFALALLHSITSLFLIPDHFPLTFYPEHFKTFFFGLLGMLTLLVLFIISIHFVVNLLNKKLWWSLQNWGVRIAGIFILLHVVPMKYTGWINWYIKGANAELARQYLPPAGLLVVSLGAVVLIVRIMDVVLKEKAQKITEIIFGLYIIFLIATFSWGIYKNNPPKPLDWESCIKISGSRIQENYPAACVSPDGRRVVKPIN